MFIDSHFAVKLPSEIAFKYSAKANAILIVIRPINGAAMNLSLPFDFSQRFGLSVNPGFSQNIRHSALPTSQERFPSSKMPALHIQAKMICLNYEPATSIP